MKAVSPLYSDSLVKMVKKVRKEWCLSYDAIFRNPDWISGEERVYWQMQFEFWEICDHLFADEWKGRRVAMELFNLFDKYEKVTERMAESGMFPEFSALYYRVAAKYDQEE